MGAGKENISLYELITRVFLKVGQKYIPSNISLKNFSPTHSLPIIPFIGAKSLNAIIMPYMGP